MLRVLVCRHVGHDQLGVEGQEEEKHHGHRAAQEARDGEYLIGPDQVGYDETQARWELFAGRVHVCLVPHVILINQVIEDAVGYPDTVEADDRVEEQKQKEVLVVVQTDTGVYPHAMMVHFLAAHVAEAAVLRAGRLGYVTSLAPIDRAEEHVVAVVAFHGTLKLGPTRVLAQVPGVRRARLVVAPVAGSDERD